jgi:agmatinase
MFPRKIDFLRGEGVLLFTERHELLFERLEGKHPEAAEAYIDALIRVAELLKYNLKPTWLPFRSTPNRKPSTGSSRAGQRTRHSAEPGPINLNRYLTASPKLGIPTFFNLPVALTPEDLLAGKVDVAIMGAGFDTGTGFRGAAYGPRAVRTGEVYKGQGLVVPQHMHTMVSEFNELIVVAYGDVAVDPLNLERSVGHVREMVREVAQTKTVPMIVGGDHALMYPDVAGVVDVYGAGNVGWFISMRITTPAAVTITCCPMPSRWRDCWPKSWCLARISSRWACGACGRARKDSSGCARTACVTTPWPKWKSLAGKR